MTQVELDIIDPQDQANINELYEDFTEDDGDYKIITDQINEVKTYDERLLAIQTQANIILGDLSNPKDGTYDTAVIDVTTVLNRVNDILEYNIPNPEDNNRTRIQSMYDTWYNGKQAIVTTKDNNNLPEYTDTIYADLLDPSSGYTLSTGSIWFIVKE